VSDVVAAMMRTGTAFEDPTLALLHQRDAQVVTAIFSACFPREVRAMPVERMHVLVDQMLDDLRAGGYGDRVPPGSGKELCARWVSRQWLLRDVDDEVGGEVYRLTSAAQSALLTVRNLTRDRTSVSEHRISTIVAAVRALNAKANPDRSARVEVLQQQRAAIDRQLEQLESGEPMPTPSADYMLEGYLDLLNLIGDLPGDFERVQESFVRQRAQVLEQFRGDGRAAGEVIGSYLEQSDALMDTIEGRAFQGALELLRDPDMLDQLDSDLTDLLGLPVAEDILMPSDRAELAGMVQTLASGISDVVARRQRVTQVLRQNIRTYDATQDRRVEEVLHHLDTAFPGWLAGTGPRTIVPLELLPARPQFKHLREQMHDPREDTALEPLNGPDGDIPTPLSMEAMRALGGPDMPALRHHLTAAWAADPDSTLGSAFASLPDRLRRPADLLGALQVAADSAQVGWAEGTEPITTLRPDGTPRTWLVPRVAVGATRAPDQMALTDLIDELTAEIA
jgi:hypothetical protein